jgi:hypothetical protein
VTAKQSQNNTTLDNLVSYYRNIDKTYFFQQRKDILLGYLLIHDAIEESGVNRKEFAERLIAEELWDNSVQTFESYMSVISWAYDNYDDDDFGYDIVDDVAVLTGSFTSLGEIRKAYAETKQGDKNTSPKAKASADTEAKRIAKGKSKKELLALIAELQKLVK